jgi:L-iditol 2-dehydrogenase
MRVATYYNNSDVRLEERPLPSIGPGEMLVRVDACGICGSDVMEWYRINRAPLVLGHELTGHLVEVGAGVEKYHAGDRVACCHHVPCNSCHFCLSGHHTVCDTHRRTSFDPGGFSEYIRLLPVQVDHGVYLLPDDVSDEEGAFVEPLGCAVRGQRLARMQPGQSLLVVGSGIAGLLQIQLARAMGMGCIMATDISDYRLVVAKRLGANAVARAEAAGPDFVRQSNDGRLADVVAICTGAGEAIEQAFACVERGGVILFFAPTRPGVTVPVEMWNLWHNEVSITTCYSAAPVDATLALELIRRRRVDVRQMITHRLGLGEAEVGFSLVASAEQSIKVIIECQR